MPRVRVIELVAAIALSLASIAAEVHAAKEDEPAASTHKKDDPKDIRVLIPSFSKDVNDNGCRVRASPEEQFAETDIAHVPFIELISETTGRYSVRAILDPPATLTASLAPLDPAMRTLVLLDVLRNGLGRDGLHTFFFMSSAQHAAAIRDTLDAAGLKREHQLFVDAMKLFGPEYPVDNELRAQRFSYSSLDTPLNDLDKRMLDLARSFGDREAMGRTMVAYVERTPDLWGGIEGKRKQLGERARLRFLNQSLLMKARLWEKTDAEIPAALAAMPVEERTLLVMEIFNRDFSNGGVHQFFFNSSGDVALEAYDAFRELGLQRQAAIFKRALDMFPGPYVRNNQKRRDKFFSDDWGDWDDRLQKLTDEFYELGGGPALIKFGDSASVEGGPGIWGAMSVYARAKKLLPC